MPIPSYPLDLTAVLPSNHITGEVHVITTPRSRFFVPVGGPFFTQSMILRNNVTNALLMPNNDFKILHHHAEGSAATGKNVCAIIYITNPLIASVNLEYQCVGGVYSDTSDIIRQMIVDHPLDPDQPQLIGWEQVFGQPSQYPISAHQHLANQFWGYGDLVAGIEQLRVAVASGDNAAMAAIYRYVELVINDNNYLTAADLNGLLQTPDTSIKTHPTYNALRNRTDFSDNLPVVYMTIGKVTTSDGRGMMFRWDANSVAADDNHHILRPDSIAVNSPGRLLSLLWAENNIGPLLDMLGRYGIESAIAAANSLPTNTDLNSITSPGKYWVGNTVVNSPVDYGILEVDLIAGTIAVPHEVHQRIYWASREAIRSRSSSGVWTDWQFIKAADLAAERNIDGQSLDNVLEPDQYYYTPNCTNRPTDYGILFVYRENGSIVYQLAHGTSDSSLFTRYRAGDGTWTQWRRYVNYDEMTAAIAAATAPPNTYYWASLNQSYSGDTQHTGHYCPAGTKRLTVAMIAPGGGGGAGGFGAGGHGGGGGAGSFGQLVIEGDLTGCYLAIEQPPDNAPGLYAPSGYNSSGYGPYNNPSSIANFYDPLGNIVFSMVCRAGQTGGGGDTERGGSSYSSGGLAGANGHASLWRNPGYSARIFLHSFMANGPGGNATSGGGNASGSPGIGGTVDTSARDGYGGNPLGDGYGAAGGATGVSGPAVSSPGNGAVGHTGAAVVRME